MDAIEALIVSRAIERTVFMLCVPLLLYLGYRLFARALDDNGQARAELRDKYKFRAASFLPGSACFGLAVVIGFAVFSHALDLSKAEQDLLIRLAQAANPASQTGATASPAGPTGSAAGAKGASGVPAAGSARR